MKKKRKKKSKFWSVFWIVVFSQLFGVGLLQLLGVMPYIPHWAFLPPIYKVGFAIGVIFREGITIARINRKNRKRGW